MPRHALSDTKKAQIVSEHRAKCMKLAIARYREELAKPTTTKKLGLRKVCKMAEEEYFKETKIPVHLNYTTLRNLANNLTQSIRETNEARGWLSPEETDEVIDFILEMAELGFGLSHRRLKEHVDELLSARMGEDFPEGGVGKKWTHRFVEKHSNRLHTYTARGLHDLRGKAANPEMKKRWFDLVEKVQLEGDDGKLIAPECTWAMDESGFQANGGEGYEKVIAGKKKKVVYQQQAGSCENTTVLVTISAAGEALKPAMIFAGKAYLPSWKQDNPAEASMGYSQKGWTDGEIGVTYAKHFDQQTRAAAKGRTRVLYVDGHASHYTRAFIVYCRANKIKVLCYPAHTTHIFQGLDVVIFSPLKVEYGRQRDENFRKTGQPVSKQNFLRVYGNAHLKVLIPALIKTAFRKTGILPFDRSVITDDKLAPSRQTCRNYISPVAAPPAVKIVSDLMLDLLQTPVQILSDASSDAADTENTEMETETETTPARPATPTGDSFLARTAMRELAATEYRFLVSNSPIKASSNPPDVPTVVLSPTKPTNRHPKSRQPTFDRSLLTIETCTPLEKTLQQALINLDGSYRAHKTQVATIQTGFVLQRLYCGRVQKQLQAQEQKKKKQGKKRGRIHSDGLPRLLTSDEFLEVVEEHELAMEQAEREKKARIDQRLQLETAVKEWERKEEERKKVNVEKLRKFEERTREWNESRAEMKASREMTLKAWEKVNPKPKKGDYIVPGTPKPTAKSLKVSEADDATLREQEEGAWTDEEDEEEEDDR